MNMLKINRKQAQDAWSCPHCGAGQDAGLGSACGTAPSGASACGSGCSAGGGCAFMTCPGCGKSFPHPDKSWLAYRLSHWLIRRERPGNPDEHATLENRT